MKKCFKVSFLLVLLVASVVVANAKYLRANSTSKKAVVESLESVSPSESGYGYYVVVTGNGVRIRAAPHLQGKIVGKVNRGTYLPYLGYVNGWYMVNYRGRARYISAQFSYVE